MKKILFCAAAVAMLGLSACSNKEAKANDSDTVAVEENVLVAEGVDSTTGDTTVVVEENVEVAPADSTVAK